jgi:hypothetical protein
VLKAEAPAATEARMMAEQEIFMMDQIERARTMNASDDLNMNCETKKVRASCLPFAIRLRVST